MERSYNPESKDKSTTADNQLFRPPNRDTAMLGKEQREREGKPQKEARPRTQKHNSVRLLFMTLEPNALASYIVR